MKMSRFSLTMVIVFLFLGGSFARLLWKTTESRRLEEIEAVRNQERSGEIKRELEKRHGAIVIDEWRAMLLSAGGPLDSADLHREFVRKDKRPFLFPGKLKDVAYEEEGYLCVFEVDHPLLLLRLILQLKCEEEVGDRLLRDNRFERTGYLVVAQISSVEKQTPFMLEYYALRGRCLNASLITDHDGN